MPSVYVETSIISYLAARPRRDLIVAARQQLTHTWWRDRRPMFDLFVSQVVLDEILAGDPDAAERRAMLVAGIPVLDIVPEIADLAAMLIQRVPCRPRPAPTPPISRRRRTTESISCPRGTPRTSRMPSCGRVSSECVGRAGIPHPSCVRRMSSWEKAMTEHREQQTWRDPIVAEVRRVREELFAAAGYDVHEFCRRLREKQAASGHPVATRPGAAKSDTPGEAV